MTHKETKTKLLQLRDDAQNPKIKDDQFVINIINFLNWIRENGPKEFHNETIKMRQLEISKRIIFTLFNEMALRTNKPMKWKLSKNLQKERDDIIEIISKDSLIFPTSITSKNLTFDYHLFSDALKIWSE